MRKIVLFFLLALPVTALAQGVGGEIRRPVKTSPQSNKVSSRTNSSSNNNSKTTTNRSNRDAILQNLVKNMVRVEGGTFMMGATTEQDPDSFDDEKPLHQVTLSSFSIGKYEVTQEEWEAVMGSNPSYFKGLKKPVEIVSWNDCQAFIRKLNDITGKKFRLPTEAEWEFAARGGKRSNNYKYSGSEDLNDVAWWSGYNESSPSNVGEKSPNELGLYDMSGNVCEWCQDWYGSYSVSSQTEPIGPLYGSARVVRGGGWIDIARVCRVSYRYYYSPRYAFNFLGFRLAL